MKVVEWIGVDLMHWTAFVLVLAVCVVAIVGCAFVRFGNMYLGWMGPHVWDYNTCDVDEGRMEDMRRTKGLINDFCGR